MFHAMMRFRAVAALLIFSAATVLFAVPADTQAAPCGLAVRCSVDSGYYIARAPDGWDGKTRLPVALFFHGWQGSAEGVAKNKSLTGQFSRLGILLIIPNGLHKTWSFPGSPSHHRDELKFVGAVMDDVMRRYPVDKQRVWATGFSLGGSMVWTLACSMGERFTAFAPIAGAFWDPVPETCPSGPANIRHIHGLTDKTVPLEGRAIRTVYKQSDVFRGFDLWKKVNGCAPQPTRFSEEGRLMCRIWDACTSGATLQLCLHKGGHSMRSEWMQGAADFVETQAKTRGVVQ